ncbi:MAG: hypothetical protein EOM50_14155 [Erysipelotrichia bacterium]|nr:hypothetical protein [Erysipelotrichia bacterium]NCC55115.1 hypothetical protein [Erysipelotrichia bacterium]
MIDDYVEKYGDKDKSNKVTLHFKLDIQFFTKKSLDYKTILLPKKEYAILISELNTNLTSEQKQSSVKSKPIGDYVCLVENNGYNDYRVISKKPIKKIGDD